MNNQVAWDSEFYISIALAGYDDPVLRSIGDFERSRTPEGDFSLNYAFLPFYPFVMRLFYYPLALFGLSDVATATLAGVLVSLIGTLGAMLALYGLVEPHLEETGGMRAVFYLLVFPTGFFLAQVYTEGLFVGLAFGSLALLQKKKLLWAAILAVFATWTRAVGGALLIALVWFWIKETNWADFQWRDLGWGMIALLPLGAFLAWKLSPWGRAFSIVEDQFFGRGIFLIKNSLSNWAVGYRAIFANNLQTRVYYLIEFGATLLGLVACFATLRRYPAESLFGLAIIGISFFSGQAQGIQRYVIAAPSVFIFLATLGKNEIFDRAWTLGSVLLMGMLATLYTFNFWVA
jgi:hypothetical protein